jgi:hypothetical protein
MPDITNDLFTDLKEKFFNVKINVIQPKKQYSSLVSDNPTHIELIGPPNQVEECRVRVLVLLDEKVNNKKKNTLSLKFRQ